MSRNNIRLKIATVIMRQATRLAERIDRRAVPKLLPWAFTFEKHRGVVFNETGCSTALRGCRLAYLCDADYDRAWTDSATLSNGDGL